jgi:hypothetical protein
LKAIEQEIPGSHAEHLVRFIRRSQQARGICRRSPLSKTGFAQG